MKRVSKVVVGVAMGVTAGIAVNAVDVLIARKKKADETRRIEAEDENCKEAIYRFRRLNNFKLADLKYVSDSGGTAIFAYDNRLNLEQMRIPKGYTLLKLVQPCGATSYALGKRLEKEELFTDYHILAYLVDDWEEI